MPLAPLRTRFAPSPTGDLHLGGLLCALVSFALARASGGAFVLRMEDLDAPRVVEGSAARIEADLARLGLAWDEPASDGRGAHAPYTQSARGALYEAALAALGELTYPCDCSRSELLAASAPHAGEERVYPGTCREKDPDRPMRRPPARRLRVPAGSVVEVVDLTAGRLRQDVGREVGDFVLRRGDGVYSYQLACALDDHAMAIDVVVRGRDLLTSTPRQLLLGRLLGARQAPRTLHLPLLVNAAGERLAKRTGGLPVRELLDRGVPAEALLGVLAHAAGFATTPHPRALAEVVAAADARLPALLRGELTLPERARVPDALLG